VGGQPAGRRSLPLAVQRQREAAGEQRHADRVEADPWICRGAVGAPPQRAQHAEDAERDVDQEDGRPAERADQEAAGCGARGRAREQEDAHHEHRPLALLAPRAGRRGQDAHRDGREWRAEQALRRPGGHKHRQRGGERAGGRGDREADQAGQVHRARTEPLREPRGRGQAGGQRQQVGADGPLHVTERTWSERAMSGTATFTMLLSTMLRNGPAASARTTTNGSVAAVAAA
jgi:hypothetical protein